MRNQLYFSMVAVGLIVGTSALADDANHGGKPAEAMGPVYEMMVSGKMMHMQAMQAADGGQWIVISRKEAETILGMDLGKTVFIPMK